MELPCLSVPEESPSQSREPKQRKRKTQPQNVDNTQSNKKSRPTSPLRRSARLLAKQAINKPSSSVQDNTVKSSTEPVESSRKRNRSISPVSTVPSSKKPRQKNTNQVFSLDLGTDIDSDSDIPVVSTKTEKGRKKSKHNTFSSVLVTDSGSESEVRSKTQKDKVISRSKKQKASNSQDTESPDRKTKSKNKGSKQKASDTSNRSKSKGKNKAGETSDQSKSRSKTPKKTVASPSTRKGKASKPPSKKWFDHCSLPPFIDFARLTMASEGNKDQVPSGASDISNTGADSASTSAPLPTDGDSNPPLDPVAEETRKLQAMLEARGLPPHLLGSLGSKMHYILHNKSLSSSNNSRAHQLLAGIESIDDEGLQLQSCIEMGQVLVMGNEDTVSGFPVKQAVPALINLLSMEHNFDMMLNACRALTYMMEALPRSASVVADAIPVLVEKLQVIQCMDVAEQALSALELLSKRHGKAVLQAGGLNACLLYLDFFSIAPQRNALSTAANCCQCVSEDDLSCVMDALPVLAGRLQHQDKPSVESCCLCFSRLVDNFIHNPKVLKDIASQGLLPNMQQLLVISPPVISSGMFGTVLRMLSHLCASCPPLAVDLLKLNIADTLRYLLMGSGELTLDNIELVSRSPNEVYEILSLAGELMPPLPKDGVFSVEELLTVKRLSPTTVQWEWQDNQNVWRPYGRMENRLIEATHQGGEEECNIALMGNIYIIDLSAMQQINEDTGTSRMIRRTNMDPADGPGQSGSKVTPKEEDARLIALREDPSIGGAFVHALFGALYEVFDSTAGPSVRIKCLKTILRIIYHSDAEVLSEILKDISVSSHIATMLKAQDYRVIIGGMQMSAILIQKLPAIFVVYFHREGVIHQLQSLRDIPLKVLATPKQEVTTPTPIPQPVVPDASQRTPTTTRKRLSDIFRKGKRQLRKTLRSRSEDTDGGPSTSATPPQEGNPLPGGGATPESSGVSVATPGPKERIQEWIKEQSISFLDQWSVSEHSNPALDVVKKLEEASQSLDPKSPSCLAALSSLHSVLVDPSSNISAFEFVHYKTHIKLMRYLTQDHHESAVPLNTRLRHFLHTFMGLPEQVTSMATWVSNSPSHSTGMGVLLQKIHMCINQLEQLPVKVHDMPGRRGSQALRFFNTHQIKCVLERHPSAVGSGQWKGGPLRIDPLATIQTLERYMMIRGFGRHGGRRGEELDSEDSEVDESYIMTIGGPGQGSDNRHFVEFLIGDTVLPYHMTVFEAIRQITMGGLAHDSEEEMTPLGRPEIWIKTHTIHYRPVTSSDFTGPNAAHSGLITRSLSASLPSPPHNSHSSRKHTWSSGGGVPAFRRRPVPGKSPVAMETTSVLTTGVVAPRLTRSTAKSSPPPHPLRSHSDSGLKLMTPEADEAVKEKEKKHVQLPLHRALQSAADLHQVLDDPCVPVLCLLKAIHTISQHWTDLYPGLAGSPILPGSEFISSKLTAKTNRQLQDPLNVMTANFPPWVRGLATNCPFLFPFECRQTLFYLTAFDRDRALGRLHDQRPDLASSDSPQSTVTPRLEKKKQCVNRDNLLEQAEKLLNELASSKAVLEIHYQDEVGTGLGPTLEFYTLVSRELLRSDLMLWRGDLCPIPGVPSGASSVSQYIHSPVGVFPAPLGPSTKFTLVEEVCSKFRFLGKLMAKAILDSRMLDIPLSEAFYKWMLGLEHTFTAQDLQHVDPVVARSFSQLASVAVKKHSLESDPLLTGKALAIGIGSLTLEGGGTIEDLDLDFTLPGYPDIQLKPGGKDTAVTIHTLDEYLKLVVDWTLVRGVARQMEAFREGFSSMFPINTVQGLFSPSEMDTLICGAHLEKWDIKELMESCRPDHGFSHDSRAVQMLFEVLSTYATAEQRQFIQFVTGSPRLPVGGFKALNPPLTIVRKTVESSQNPDDFLPSVMTCVNYLKLPDYSCVEIMREKLHFAFIEGKHSFHLS